MKAEDDYAGAGFNGHLQPGTTPVLVIVDPADAYVNPECPLYAGVEGVAEDIRVLRQKARALGIPVVITKVLHEGAGRDGGIFVKKVPSLQWLRPESPFSAYIDGLAPEEGDIEIVKQYASAFAGTSLAATLTALHCDTVLIAGFSTSGCIRATATDAMQNGFVPLVVREGVGDRLPEVHEANLFDIQAKIGEVVSLEKAISVMEECAAWPSR